jgi:hypothetical protein
VGSTQGSIYMKSEYDFSQSRKNPYAKQLKRQITLRLDTTAARKRPARR